MGGKSYHDFDLEICKNGSQYRAKVLNSLAGQASHDFVAPFSDLEKENFLLRIGRPRRGVRRVESPEVESIKTFGDALFKTVFQGDLLVSLRSSQDEASRQGKGLRIRLHLTGVPEMSDLPWEFLYNRSSNQFLALSNETPLVRYLELPERIRPIEVTPPLGVLVMISSPHDYPSLEVEEEWKRLNEALADLKKAGLITLTRLEATTQALQRHLRRSESHIFHFIGHGGFDKNTQDGILVFEDSQKRGLRLRGQDLGTLLHDHRSMRLAVLNACEGGRSSCDDPFSGAAQSLIQQGIAAVIAMQFEITDDAAITFAQEFYQAVADNYPVDAALAEARKAIFSLGPGPEWATPVLYLRAPDGHIFDVKKLSDEQLQQARAAALRSDLDTAIKQGLWDKAAEKLLAVLAANPDDADAKSKLDEVQKQQQAAKLYTSGREHYVAGRWQEAIADFEQVRLLVGSYRDRDVLSAEATRRLQQPAAPVPPPVATPLQSQVNQPAHPSPLQPQVGPPQVSTPDARVPAAKRERPDEQRSEEQDHRAKAQSSAPSPQQSKASVQPRPATKAGIGLKLAAAGVTVIALAVTLYWARSGRPEPAAKTNAEILAQLQNKIDSDSNIQSRVLMQVADGVVTLSGTVKSENEREAADRDAKNIEGVKTVFNNLDVQEPPPAPPPSGGKNGGHNSVRGQSGTKGSSSVRTTSSTAASALPAGMDPRLADLYRKAVSGDANSMFELGLAFQTGRGVSQDSYQAAIWFQKAAQAGNPLAMRDLGMLYAKGLGVGRNDQQAAFWFQQGAVAGNVGAMTALGYMYANGRGVPRDYGQAVAWYRRAAEAGDHAAMYDLGNMCELGYGTPRNLQQAIGWYRRAAQADPQTSNDVRSAAMNALRRLGVSP